MISDYVLTNTFHVKWKNAIGTAFTAVYDGRQYLITARHVVDGISNGNLIQVFLNRQWQNVQISLIGTGESHNDIAVLSCSALRKPMLSLDMHPQGPMFAQQVYIAGFPFGWKWEMFPSSRQASPFIKSAVFSGATENNDLFVLDGHGNEGFSGGPVVYNPAGCQPDVFHVIGVVSNYPVPMLKPVVDKQGNPVVDENNNPIGYIPENPGFIISVNIMCARNLIDANPVGVPVS